METYVKGIVNAEVFYSILQRLKSIKTSINLSESAGYEEIWLNGFLLRKI